MKLTRRLVYYGFWALLIYMPFHVFLSQSLSLATGGLEVWKLGKDLVLALLILFSVCLVWQQRRADRLFNLVVMLAVGYGLLHLLLWLLNPDVYHKSAALGFTYNMRLPALLLLGWSAARLNPDKFALSSVIKLTLVVSTTVVLLGLIQYLLPKDILAHFGYSLARGARAAFFIDDNASLPRIMSTLRDPNSLGAFLLVPLAALAALVLKARRLKQRLFLVGLWLVHALALLLTFSRSAWLAAALTLALVVYWSSRQRLAALTKRLWPLAVAAAALLVVIGITLSGSQFGQHYLIHSTQEAVVDLDSNDYHRLFAKQALSGIAQQPLGHGPGTAGLASIHNPAGPQLTENYYLQIAYEVGLLGLALFAALNVLVYWRLGRQRGLLAGILLACFWGYVVTNMLLHTWSNEAVAAQWWLLAGLAMAGAANGDDTAHARR